MIWFFTLLKRYFASGSLNIMVGFNMNKTLKFIYIGVIIVLCGGLIASLFGYEIGVAIFLLGFVIAVGGLASLIVVMIKGVFRK